MESEIDYAKFCYKKLNFGVKNRLEYFYISRDAGKEFELFNSHGLSLNIPYVFLHEDISRGFVIDRTHITNTSYPIVCPNQVNNIFDYLYILENAAEIHCMDSCFRHMCDYIKTTNLKFYHLNKFKTRSYRHILPISAGWTLVDY